MSEATKTLAYRYRLMLTPAQEDILDSSQEQLRLVWNHLVRSQHKAEHEWKHGRAVSIKNELLELKLAREAKGVIVNLALKVAEESKVSPKEALQIMRREKLEKKALITKGKRGGLWSRRNLAVMYAEPVVSSKVDCYYGLGSGMYQALCNKFQKCSEMWLKGKFQQPRFKCKGEPVAMQRQVQKTDFKLERFSDLSTFGGKTKKRQTKGQALKKCEVIIHRPLPNSAKIKQIAVSGRRGQRYLIVMFKALMSEVAKNFLATNRTAGVDPGIKIALTITPLDSPDYGTSDHKKLEPQLARDKRFLKRLRRLDRKLDRQRRKNNPDCYDEQHRSIKGKRPTIVKENMRRTQDRITRMHSHLAESRRDFYHNAACDILKSFDNIAVGKWRPTQTRHTLGKSSGPSRRAINRKTYDHAISLFIMYLKDKAERSTTPKEIQDVSEAYTTRNCPKCSKPTGPMGTEDLDKREWTCPHCNTIFQRDAAAAWQIAKRFKAKDASTLQPVESQDSTNSASAQTQA